MNPAPLLTAQGSVADLSVHQTVEDAISKAESAYPHPFINGIKYFVARTHIEAVGLVLLSLKNPFWESEVTLKHLGEFSLKERSVLQRLAAQPLQDLSEKLPIHLPLVEAFLNKFTKKELEKIVHQANQRSPAAIRQHKVSYKKGNVNLNLPKHQNPSKQLFVVIEAIKQGSPETLICNYQFVVKKPSRDQLKQKEESEKQNTQNKRAPVDLLSLGWSSLLGLLLLLLFLYTLQQILVKNNSAFEVFPPHATIKQFIREHIVGIGAQAASDNL